MINDYNRLICGIGTALGRLERIAPAQISGEIASVAGLLVEIAGLGGIIAVGDRVRLSARDGTAQAGEVVGIAGALAQVMPYGGVTGLGPGGEARFVPEGAVLAPCAAWLGRVVDPTGAPLDSGVPLPTGKPLRVRARAPSAVQRARLGEGLSLGVRALDLFTPCRSGQRIGVFAGAGAGKSSLLAMLGFGAGCDVVVVALVGERGREVREFIEDALGGEGMARAVVVVATSDTPPVMRREAAYAAMTIAEYFRDQGKHVLLLMDSLTRFCLALREMRLSAGELPARGGYPPGVFAELPQLLERAGPGIPGKDGIAGQITGIFTVLVEGDDITEPVADAARGLLDGHILLDRAIAEQGRYPAVDVLRSLSRTAPLGQAEAALARRAREILALAASVEDLVRLGAYREGSDAAVDQALRLAPQILAMLQQKREEVSDQRAAFASLAAILAA